MTRPWRPGEGEAITTLYAWVATEPDGGEGVCSMILPNGMHMPLIGADRARVESLRSAAERTRRMSGYPVKLKMFSSGVVIDEIE